MMSIGATLLVMAYGDTPLMDHARFIPVYAMGSTFLTAAWPSLLRIIGLPRSTMVDISGRSVEHQGYLPVPLSEVLVDNDSNQDDVAARISIFSWNQEQERQRSSSGLTLTPPTAEHQDAQTSTESALHCAFHPGDVAHMGPSSAYSGGSSYTGASLSLDSHGRCPSEMSSNVAAHFFPETVGGRVRRISNQRRLYMRDHRYMDRRPGFDVRMRSNPSGTVLYKALSV